MKSADAVLAAVLAPSTVETAFAVMRAMMSAAVDDGAIPVNPCSRLPLPRVQPREVEPLPAAAVLALADALPGRYRVCVPLAAGAGLRFGEATGLTLPRVNFLQRRIVVVEQAQNGALAPLKTRASRRTVPADDWVLARRREGSRAAAGHALSRAAALLRLRPDRREPQPKVIQSLLGHATIAETMDAYGHLFPDSEDLGRGAVESALGSALAEQERNGRAP